MNRRGQSIVEFAIVFPLFIFILFAFLYMAIFMHDYLAMGELGREIARYESVGKKYIDIKDNLHIDNRLTSMYKIKEIVPGVDIIQNNDPTLGENVTVTLTMERQDDGIIVLVKPFMPVDMSTTLTMRKEG